MADLDESRLVIEFEDTGEAFDQTISFRLQSSFLTPADQWSCVVANESKPWLLRRKFYPGRAVKLYLGDRLQAIGRIGRTRSSGGGSGALQVTGRDYFDGLIDPSIDPSVRITNRMTLADALLEGLRPLGITEIESSLEEVTAKKMGPVAFRTEKAALAQFAEEFNSQRQSAADSGRSTVLFSDSFSPDTQAFIDALPSQTVRIPITAQVRELKPNKDGEGAYQWASRLAARYHLSVQPGSKRTAVAVVAPDYSSDVRFSFSRPGNVESASCERNGEDVPTFVNASGRFVDEKQQAKGGFSGISLTDESAGFVNSNEGRKFVEASQMVTGRIKRNESNEPPALYKPIYFKDDKARSAEELRSSASRMVANKLRGFFKYQANLNAHTDIATGATFATNTLADVQDQVEDVSERLWIAETVLSKGSGQGKRADITMIIPGTYRL